MLPPELYIKGIFQVHRWIRFNENSERQVPDTPVDLCQKRKLQIHGWPYLNDTFFGYSARQVPDTPVDLFQKRKLQIHGWPYLNDTFLDILQGRFQIHRWTYVKK